MAFTLWFGRFLAIWHQYVSVCISSTTLTRDQLFLPPPPPPPPCVCGVGPAVLPCLPEDLICSMPAGPVRQGKRAGQYRSALCERHGSKTVTFSESQRLFPDTVFINVCGAQELLRNEFRQPMYPELVFFKSLWGLGTEAEFIPWNRFLGSINVLKYGFWLYIGWRNSFLRRRIDSWAPQTF